MARRQDDDDSYTPSNRGADAWAAGAELGQQAAARSRAKGALKKTQKKAAQPTGLSTTSPVLTSLIPTQPVQTFKHGGRVRKTGVALLHRGELVIPAGKHRGRKASRTKKTFIKA